MPGMHSSTRWMAALVIVLGVGLPLAGCASSTSTAPKGTDPAKVEPVGDTGVKKLTLTDKAAQRLAIQTAPVVEQRTRVGSTETVRLLIPYSALLYLPAGQTVTYTNPEGLSYVRQNVTVESIQGNTAVLTQGPPAGTAVVTVGGAELWGTEFGVK